MGRPDKRRTKRAANSRDWNRQAIASWTYTDTLSSRKHDDAYHMRRIDRALEEEYRQFLAEIGL